MGVAYIKQNLLDWVTQQWVIVFGRRIYKDEHDWLLGPFGKTNGIGLKFINQLAESEGLVIDKNKKYKGLIQSVDQLKMPEDEINALCKNVIDFYENTSNYRFDLKIKWNPFFKGFGILLKILFSNRIEQLNIPTNNIQNPEALKSEIIHLKDAKTTEVKHIIWLRTFKTTGQVVYSGVYETCKIPSDKTCIKAIFPLPNGNATVILEPTVGKNGELILTSSGKKFCDSGFYFLLKDSTGKLWAKYIRSFKDKLVASAENNRIKVEQKLTLWNICVVKFEYDIEKLQNKV